MVPDLAAENFVLLTRISRYLLREVAQAWLAVTLVLVVVLLSNRLVQFMEEAISGDVPPGVIFTLLGLKAVANLGKVLPASFFLGIILALGRLYRDSEMAAMTACGVGPGRLYRALYLIAVPLALLVAYCSLVLGPWAERSAARTLAEAQRSAQFQGVRPGQFIAFADGRAVVYAASVTEAGIMRDVFAELRDESGITLVVAESARREYDPETGDEFLVLEQGRRYDGRFGAAAWRIIEFAEHGIRIDEPGTPEFDAGRDAIPTAMLWSSDRARWRAELHWRLALPVSTLVLTLIALPLAQSTPRDGRYAKLVTAVLLYVVYLNLLKMGQDGLGHGDYPLALGLWWVHALAAGVGVAMLALRFRVFRRPPRRAVP